MTNVMNMFIFIGLAV